MTSDRSNDSYNSGFAGIIREGIQQLKGNARTVLFNFLVECNHSDNPDFRFNCEPFPLRRGQWVTSYIKLKELTGLSRQQIRTALNKLLKITNLSAKNINNQATLLTLDNIDLYLVSKNELTNKITKRKTNLQPTLSQPSTINNNVNNGNNENNENNYSKLQIPKSSDLKTPSQTLPQEKREIPENLRDEIGNMQPIGNLLGFSKQGFDGKNYEAVNGKPFISTNTQSAEFAAASFVHNLNESAKRRAQRNAPGWDLFYLAGVYIAGIHERGKPEKGFNAAFPGWCLSYTKGKQP